RAPRHRPGIAEVSLGEGLSHAGRRRRSPGPRRLDRARRADARGRAVEDPANAVVRSEEHTSELQSRFDLVCRLLLEKKKNICTRKILWSTRSIAAARQTRAVRRAALVARASRRGATHSARSAAPSPLRPSTIVMSRP